MAVDKRTGILDKLKASQAQKPAGPAAISSSLRDINTTQLTGHDMNTVSAELREDEKDYNSGYIGLPSGEKNFLELVQPAEPDFNLDQYENDQKYADYRSMDRADSDETYRQNSGTESTYGRGHRPPSQPSTGTGRTPSAATGPSAPINIGRVGPVELGLRQKEFYSNLGNVEKVTGIKASTLGPLWAIESGFSKNQLSPTGRQGPMQFTRGTFAAMIRQYGDRIPGMEEFAVGLRNGTIKPNDERLQAFRNDQKVAGYASAFYVGEIAKSLKVDPNDPKNLGQIYAAYNVGLGSVQKLKANADNDQSAQRLLGKVADVNPMFYDKGRANSAQALANYQAAMDNASLSFNKQIVAKLDPSLAPSTSVASAVNGPAIKSAAKPSTDFGATPTVVAAAAPAPTPAAKAEKPKEVVAERGFFDRVFRGVYGETEPAPKVAAAAPAPERKGVSIMSLIYS